jgi:hypothetical protein
MKIKPAVVRILAICCFSFLCCSKHSSGPDDSGSPEEKVKAKTIWAASSASFIGENLGGIESWQRLNSRLKAANGGHALQGRRSYDKGIPLNFASSAMAEDAGNCPVSIGSFKPDWVQTANGTNADAIMNFIKSIPDDRTVYLVFYHEPEDNVNSFQTSDVLLRAFARYVDIVLSSGKTNVHPCFVLMSWTFKTQSGRNPDDFNMGKYLKPGQIDKVIAGLDGYAQDPSMSAKSIFEAPFQKLATYGFTRFGIFETGAHASANDPADRAGWINGLGEWVNSRNDIELVSWFNNGNGQHAGPTGWYLGTWNVTGNVYSWDDSDGTVSAYSKLLE